MNREQLEETEGLKLHDLPKEKLPDAIADCLDKSIEKLDRMFLLICKTRASYIRAKRLHQAEDYVNSHNARVFANTQLKLLSMLLEKNFTIEHK